MPNTIFHIASVKPLTTDNRCTDSRPLKNRGKRSGLHPSHLFQWPGWNRAQNYNLLFRLLPSKHVYSTMIPGTVSSNWHLWKTTELQIHALWLAFGMQSLPGDSPVTIYDG